MMKYAGASFFVYCQKTNLYVRWGERKFVMGFSIWFLIGAALVFFMQAGFAMVETGFTRAKNAGNIIMKNVMDFCIGTIVFVLLGFGLLLGEDTFFGLIGRPDLQIFTNFSEWVAVNGSNFVFNLVFCATTATIVSGAMAERTKFSAYCIYSAVISLVVYPIEAHWVWGGGWLAAKGFIDFAGSGAIHMVGGIASLVGAAILGPRIGKYYIDKKTGKKKSRAIPGHSITLGALGAFILWFGWYGFNGAAATNITSLGSIFLTTTVSPAVATVVCMIVTWLKNGKPDVSMCINASLAGLVGITAGCAYVDTTGAIIIGAVSGVLVIIGVEFIDKVLHVDDPVGAIAVHGLNGIWGTLAVGLFANPHLVDAFDSSGEALTGVAGLFYGGGASLLGIQALGVLSIGAYTAIAMILVFLVIKKLNGLRVSKEEEILGLDVTEHGLPSAYADFSFAPEVGVYLGEEEPGEEIEVIGKPAPVVHLPASELSAENIFTKVDIITKPEKLEDLKTELNKIGITGMTVSHVLGYGMQKGNVTKYRGVDMVVNFLPKVKVEIIVCKVPVQKVVDAAQQVLYTGKYGDGKIFVYDVEDVVKIRTGETGYDALQDS
jgi:Amt family ammonium transporter